MSSLKSAGEHVTERMMRGNPPLEATILEAAKNRSCQSSAFHLLPLRSDGFALPAQCCYRSMSSLDWTAVQADTYQMLNA